MAEHDTHSPDRSWLAFVAALAIAGFVALIATACGESRSDREAARYADSLCTAISGWETKVGAIATSLDSGSPKNVARSKLDQAAAETSTLVGQIHALEVPDVDGAAEAKRNVDRFVGDSQTTVSAVQAGLTRIEAYGTGTANVATVVVPVGLQLANLVTEGKTTVTSLEQIKGPFEHAVKGSDTCQGLKPSAEQRT